MDAKRIICVDIIRDGYEIFLDHYRPNNTEFYLTEGNELRGIENRSVDFIFTMDSLVRTDIDTLKKYISEVGRVIKPNGKICMHLPCVDVAGSARLNFTNFTLKQMQEFCDEYLPKSLNIELDDKTIGHGVLLRTSCAKNN